MKKFLKRTLWLGKWAAWIGLVFVWLADPIAWLLGLPDPPFPARNRRQWLAAPRNGLAGDALFSAPGDNEHVAHEPLPHHVRR
jgi:hypothetical protein